MTQDADVADIVAGKVIETLRAATLAKHVLEGEFGWTLLRDLSRARYISPLRRRLSEGDDVLRKNLLEQLEMLNRSVIDSKGDLAREAAAAAVFLVRISKDILREEHDKSGALRAAARELFASLASAALDDDKWKELRVELALQLAADEVAGQEAIEFLLCEEKSLEEVRYRYFETRSMAELYQRIRARWDTQSLEEQVSKSLESFGGLSPFLQGAPAPGGAGDTVLLVAQFARALEEKEREKRQRAMEEWIARAGRSQRLIQWELCIDHDGKYVALGARDKMATVLDAEYLDEVTAEWWRHVMEYEPVPIGRPTRRPTGSESPDHSPEELAALARRALSLFQETLAAIETVAQGRDIQVETATKVREEWSSDRAGILLVTDGELTFYALRWLVSGKKWHRPILRNGIVELEEIDFVDFLEFLGLGCPRGQEVLLTARWRSFVRWLRNYPEGTLLRSVALNRAATNVVEQFLVELAERWAARYTPFDWTSRSCRVPLLPSEVFLRAYRAWPSHLLVSTIHATRKDEEIRPISFGFATVIGDLPADTASWSICKMQQDTGGTELVSGVPGVAPDPSSGHILRSWLNAHCSTLSGIGMSLGVSSEMAKSLIDAKFIEWKKTIWPAKTELWFTDRHDIVRHNMPLLGTEDWTKSWDAICTHLRAATGLVEDPRVRWPGSRDQAQLFWNEMKGFFGGDARLNGGNGRPLSLNGIFMLLCAFHKRRFPASTVEWPPLEVSKTYQRETLSDGRVPAAECRSLDHRIVAELLLELFKHLLVGREGETTLTAVKREEGGLRLSLKIPFANRGAERSSLWGALLSGGGGDLSRSIRAYHDLLQSTERSNWIPGDVLVVPAGLPLGSATDLVFTCGRLR